MNEYDKLKREVEDKIVEIEKDLKSGSKWGGVVSKFNRGCDWLDNVGLVRYRKCYLFIVIILTLIVAVVV